jgi:mxaJ protein
MGYTRFFVLVAAIAFCVGPVAARELRVCADPNNLPFSNAAGQGFENRIMELLARDLGADLQYVWWAQRRGFLRNTLNEGKCDVVAGIASEVEMLATTPPYYRSTYVFVQRPGSSPPLASLDDPRLARLTIGVQLIGDDGANTPPAHALARRGNIDNVRGYLVYGDYRDEAPQAAIVTAVAQGEIDVAIVWGPVAGYFARRAAAPLQLTPVTPALDDPQWPMTFSIAMGTRRKDVQLQQELTQALQRNRAAIEAILREYGVPLVGDPTSASEPGAYSSALPR